MTWKCGKKLWIFGLRHVKIVTQFIKQITINIWFNLHKSFVLNHSGCHEIQLWSTEACESVRKSCEYLHSVKMVTQFITQITDKLALTKTTQIFIQYIITTLQLYSIPRWFQRSLNLTIYLGLLHLLGYNKLCVLQIKEYHWTQILCHRSVLTSTRFSASTSPNFNIWILDLSQLVRSCYHAVNHCLSRSQQPSLRVQVLGILTKQPLLSVIQAEAMTQY